MITIEIRYPGMFYKRILKSNIPESWSEINADQLIKIAILNECQDINGVDFIECFTGIKPKLLIRLDRFINFKLCNLLNFLSDVEPCTHIFFIKKIKGLNLFAPEDKLNAMTFGQFIFCESYYNEWVREPDNESLIRFVGALYLGKQETFSAEGIEKRSLLLNQCSTVKLKAIALNYSMVIRWMQLRYPMVFTEGKNQGDQEITKKMVSSVWVKLFESIVGDDLIHRDSYAQLPIHAVLKYMTRKYIEGLKVD